jgi:hypothetical protein
MQEFGRFDVALPVSSAYATVQYSPTQTNRGARGVIIHLDGQGPTTVGVYSLQVECLDPASNNWASLTTFAASSTGTTTTFHDLYIVYPGAAETAATVGVQVQSLPLPYFWRTKCTLSTGDSTSWKWSVGYQLIP